MEYKPHEDDKEIPPDDLFLCLRPVLIFGRIVGCFPLCEIFRMNKEKLPTWRSHFCRFVRYVILPFLVFRVFILVCLSIYILTAKLFGSMGTFDIIRSTFNQSLTGILVIFIVGNFIWGTDRFCLLFKTWRELSSRIQFQVVSHGLKRKVSIILWVTMFSAISENGVNISRSFRFDTEDIGLGEKSFLQTFYSGHHPLMSKFVPYHPAVAVTLFVSDYFMLYALNISSIAAICICFSLHEKFKGLVAHVKRLEKQSTVPWDLVRQDYGILVELLEHVQDFLSLHIFSSVCLVLYWICISIFLNLGSINGSLLDIIYALWAFAHLVARFLLLCFPAAKIKESSEELWRILQKCPDSQYSFEVQRLEKLLSRPAGLTGLGFFTISKAFILGFLNIIFTIEIVLLQVSTTVNT